MGWQWRQLDHMQIICTSLQPDNHASTSSLSFYRPDALPDAQPAVSKHWRQGTHLALLITYVQCGVNTFTQQQSTVFTESRDIFIINHQSHSITAVTHRLQTSFNYGNKQHFLSSAKFTSSAADGGTCPQQDPIPTRDLPPHKTRPAF